MISTDYAHLLIFAANHIPSPLLVPDLASQVAVPRHHFDPQPPKVLLCLGYIPWGHDQNSFGWIRVISPGRSPALQVP